MSGPDPGFFSRLLFALQVFWRILSDPAFAVQVGGLSRREALPAPAAAEPVALRETAPESALQLLGLLQQEGRFVDFLQENVSAYSDTDIGAAARVIHEGCRRALREHLRIEPVRTEAEGSRLTLEEGFNAGTVRLTGNVVGKPPFTGTLMHRGWQVAEFKLPKLATGHDVHILAPAEVEL
jgi:hypothetical protein